MTRIASFGPLVSFFFFIKLVLFIYILNNIYSLYGHVKGTEGLREGGDEDNGPLFVFFFFSFALFLY